MDSTDMTNQNIKTIIQDLINEIKATVETREEEIAVEEVMEGLPLSLPQHRGKALYAPSHRGKTSSSLAEGAFLQGRCHTQIQLSKSSPKVFLTSASLAGGEMLSTDFAQSPFGPSSSDTGPQTVVIDTDTDNGTTSAATVDEDKTRRRRKICEKRLTTGQGCRSEEYFWGAGRMSKYNFNLIFQWLQELIL